MKPSAAVASPARGAPRRRGLLALPGLAGAVMYLAGQLGDAHWWLDRLSHFSPYYVGAMVFSAVVLVIARARREGFLMALFAVPGALQVGPYLPAPDEAVASAASLRVLWFNVSFNNARYDALLSYLEETDFDVVVFGEVTEAWARHLAPLQRSYPYIVNGPRPEGFGIAVYSKIEPGDVRIVDLDARGLRAAVTASLAVGKQSLRLFAAHLAPPFDAYTTALRNAQLASLAREVRRFDDVLVVGDLNITPWSPAYAAFEQQVGAINCGRGRGIVGTWPTHNALVRIPIDHCLARGRFALPSITRGPHLGSDHFPLVVDVATPMDAASR